MKKHTMLTAGMDIGDRHTKVCVVDEEDGEIVVVEETHIRSTQADVTRYFGSRQPMLVAGFWGSGTSTCNLLGLIAPHLSNSGGQALRLATY